MTVYFLNSRTSTLQKDGGETRELSWSTSYKKKKEGLPLLLLFSPTQRTGAYTILLLALISDGLLVALNSREARITIVLIHRHAIWLGETRRASAARLGGLLAPDPGALAVKSL